MKKGFSLIEVLVFITVFGVFFIIAIATVTLSLNNMKVSEHKILATKYAEELREWLRAEKEIDWNKFTNDRMHNYCFNADLSSWPLSTGLCDSTDYTGITGINPQIFKREVALTGTGIPVTSVSVDITVSWQEASKNYSVPLSTAFTLWE